MGRKKTRSKAEVNDPIPSAVILQLKVKEVLIDLVQSVEESIEREEIALSVTTTSSCLQSAIGSDDLPVQFGSSKKNKRRKPQKRIDDLLNEPAKRQCLGHDKLLRVVGEFDNHFHVLCADGKWRRAVCLGVGAGQPPLRYSLLQLSDSGETMEIERSVHCMAPLSAGKAASDRTSCENEVFRDWERWEDVSPKYWDQRFRLFSRFDRGVRLDAESWYSVTPEAIADHISTVCKERSLSAGVAVDSVLDIFSGCGGNTISLAKCFNVVTSVEIDPVKCQHCVHNANLYEVASKVNVVCSDICNFLDGLKGRCSNDPMPVVESAEIGTYPSPCSDRNENFAPIFDLAILSPPWGGPAYLESKEFHLSSITFRCGDLSKLCKDISGFCRRQVLILPRNTSQTELLQLTRRLGQPYLLEDIHLHGKHKVTVAYIGDIFGPSQRG